MNASPRTVMNKAQEIPTMANKSNKHRTSPQRPYRTYDKDELPPSRQRDYRDPKDREYEFDGGDTRREDRDDDRD